MVVDIPKDVTDPSHKVAYSYPEQVKMAPYQPTDKGHRGQIKRAVKTRPGQASSYLCWCVVVIDNASEQLTALAQKLNFPVTNTLMGLGGYPGTDRQYLGMLGMHGTFEANTAMHHADVIFAIGARFDDRVTNDLDKFCPHATIIHVDVDPTSVSKISKPIFPSLGPVPLCWLKCTAQ